MGKAVNELKQRKAARKAAKRALVMDYVLGTIAWSMILSVLTIIAITVY